MHKHYIQNKVQMKVHIIQIKRFNLVQIKKKSCGCWRITTFQGWTTLTCFFKVFKMYHDFFLTQKTNFLSKSPLKRKLKLSLSDVKRLCVCVCNIFFLVDDLNLYCYFFKVSDWQSLFSDWDLEHEINMRITILRSFCLINMFIL